MFGLSEMALVLIVVVLVLGAKKLPELARSAGKAARILKSERKAMKEENASRPVPGAKTQAPHVVTGRVVERDTPHERS
ncbi:twin-arginine translocase TatA/TatE family subunit [Streptomyces albus]